MLSKLSFKHWLFSLCVLIKYHKKERTFCCFPTTKLTGNTENRCDDVRQTEAPETCEVWVGTRGGAERQHVLVQVSFLEAQMQVQDLCHGLETNPVEGKGNEPKCYRDKDLGSSHGELRSWDGPSERPQVQTRGLVLYVPASAKPWVRGRRGDERSYHKEES